MRGTRTEAPFSWFGGKRRLASEIVALMPPHSIYVEVFGGSGAVLFAKPPSPVEVYNDLDKGLVGFFRVLRDPEKAARLVEQLRLTPYSRSEYRDARDTWADEALDEVERAKRWYIVAQQSFSGNFGRSWSFSVGNSDRGMASAVSRWQSAIERLPECTGRLSRCQVECLDWRNVIDYYDSGDTLFYLDPPYVPDTRRGGEYAHELHADEHGELAERLRRLQGKALLSGYDSAAYAPLLAAGWSMRKFEAHCHAAARTRVSGLQGKGNASHQTRTECLWISPSAVGVQPLLSFEAEAVAR